MQIIYFSRKDDLLEHLSGDKTEKLFVTPSPAKADGLRSLVRSSASGDVITIAKFTALLIQDLWPLGDYPKIKKKSELLLILGILRQHHFPEIGHEQFIQAYNLFSDLRSFTLDQDALSTVIDEQPEQIRVLVQLFWKLLDLSGFSDEHGAYHMIAERLRHTEEIESLNKTYVFWGFQHLNGQQVDLIKALAIRYEVIIPFPLSLKDKLKKSDWPTWLRDHKTVELELSHSLSPAKASYLDINSREIAKTLQSLMAEGDQVILGVSKLSASHIDVVPSQKVMFKIPHKMLNMELAEVAESLRSFSGSMLELKEKCLAQMQSFRTPKLFRAWQLYWEALEAIGEMTDAELVVNSNFLKVLDEVSRLNQPRISYVPVSQDKATIDLKDMSSLEEIDNKRRVILCIDERFEEIQGLGQAYPESIQQALATLGPIKRNELELLFRGWEFYDLMSRSEVIVLMNGETLKHSLIWKRLFKPIELLSVERKRNYPDRLLVDHLKSISVRSFSGSFSASKLQTYIDCPRKFYFSHVDKIFPEISLERDIDPRLAGTIVHEVIEIFFTNKKSMEQLVDLTRDVLLQHLSREGLHLPEDVFRKRELTLFHRASNGIGLIHDLESRIPDKIQWEFEVPFKLELPALIQGRIDCLGVSSNYIFLLDFKSSKSSAHSGDAVANLEAIQLWVYALAASGFVPNPQGKVFVLGYVVLENPEDSVFISEDSDLASSNKARKFSRFNKLKIPFSEKLTETHEKVALLTQEIMKDKSFPARPSDKSICIFCDLNQVCVKSEVLDAPSS